MKVITTTYGSISAYNTNSYNSIIYNTLYGNGNSIALPLNNFLIGSTNNVPVAKTLEQTKTILGIGSVIDWLSCDNNIDTCDNSNGTCDQSFIINNQIN